VVECLLYKCEALSSNPSPTERKKEKKALSSSPSTQKKKRKEEEEMSQARSAEIRRIMVPEQPGQKCSRDPISTEKAGCGVMCLLSWLHS
jgi:ABC-type uncharacterized transport system involved in gliding motility auxiliary subunit